MVKIVNKRLTGGELCHYPHFIIDCLYVEIINDVYKYKEVYREKNIKQTLGVFSKIYEDVMLNKNIELPTEEFDKLQTAAQSFPTKEAYTDIKYINKFRNFIFSRFNIDPYIYIENYPEVLLIKRGERVELVTDDSLKTLHTNVSNGRERREIDDIDAVESHLYATYGDKFKVVSLENTSFETQVKLFNNAKLIVMAHGGATANLLFCKTKTTVVEIPCGINFIWFNVCFSNLQLYYIKFNPNKSCEIIKFLSNLKCARPNCIFTIHSKLGIPYCCKRCEISNSHGPRCEHNQLRIGLH